MAYMEAKKQSGKIDLSLEFSDQWAWGLILTLVTAVVSLLVSFQAAAFLLLFFIVAWWVWEREEAGFLLLLILLPILPMLKIAQTIGTFTLVKDVIIFTLLFKLVLVPLARKSLAYRPNILLAPLIALLAWMAIVLARADSFLLGILRARDVGLYILLYLAVLWLGPSWQKQKERLKWLVGIVLATLALGVYQWFYAVDSAVLRFDPAREIWIPRLSSVLAHPSIFGQWLISASVLCLALLLVPASQKYRWWFGGLFLVIMPFVFLTYSRAVWIGLAVAMGVVGIAWVIKRAMTFGLKLNGKWIGTLALAGALGVAGLFAVANLTPAGGLLRSAFDPTYGSNEERLEFLARLISPLSNGEAVIGRGLGDVLEQNFREVDLTTAELAAGDARAVQLTKNKTLVDNQYLKTFIEMGVVGLVIYGWLYWRLGQGAWRLIKARDERVQAVGLMAIGFLAAFLTQGFFIDIWDIFPTNALFWVVAALVSVYNRPEIKNHV